MLLAGFCAYILHVIKNKKRNNYPDLWMLIIFGLLGIAFIRNVYITAIIYLYITAKIIFNNDKAFYGKKNIAAIGIVLQIVFMLYFVKKAQPFAFHHELLFVNQPVAVVQYFLRNRLHGNLYNQRNEGGFLEYFLYPACRTFQDSFYTDMYFEQLRYINKKSLSNWLISKQVRYAIIAENSIAHEYLPPGLWNPIFADGRYRVLKNSSMDIAGVTND
jgi:hypothetical protein